MSRAKPLPGDENEAFPAFFRAGHHVRRRLRRPEYAAICDKTYYMQSGSLTVLAGPHGLEVSSRATVDKFMNGVDVIYPDTEYEVVTRFEGNGACSEWKKTNIDFATRHEGIQRLHQRHHECQFHPAAPRQVLLDSAVNFEYWFGIADSVGRLRASDRGHREAPRRETMPHVWYGTAIVVQTIKDRVTGVGKGTPHTTSTESLASHPDSATLQADPAEPLEEREGQRHANRHLQGPDDEGASTTRCRRTVGVRERVQAQGRPPSRPANPATWCSSARERGRSRPTEALGLSNMMGHRIATLHPTGYLYQWNGRTAAGAEAPTGVYFVQSGSRILGKFFYRR